MAIQTVRANVNGTWHSLTYNSGNGRWEATINAPGATSYNQPNGYYNVQVEATNTAGTTGSASGTTLEGLRLVVKETVAPVITIQSPSNGAVVTNNQQPVTFTITDEAGGSGVDLSSVVVKLDNNTVASSEITHSTITNGYSFTYMPATALSDGQHTVTITASDNDGNTATAKSTTFKVDTVPPALNILNPVEGYISATDTVNYNGTTNDITSSPVTMAVTLNNQPQSAPTVGSGGAFNGAFTGLTDGDYTAVFTATDSAGKSSTVTRHFTVDTTAPVIQNATITPNPVDAGATMIISVEIVES